MAHQRYLKIEILAESRTEMLDVLHCVIAEMRVMPEWATTDARGRSTSIEISNVCTDENLFVLGQITDASMAEWFGAEPQQLDDVEQKHEAP